MKRFGNYLKACRRERNFENVETYLNEFRRENGEKLSISHYRNLEAGRSLPKLEAALQLCDTLKLNRFIFFSRLIRSMLLKAGLNEIEISLFVRTEEEINAITGAILTAKESKALKILHKGYLSATSAYRHLLGATKADVIFSKLLNNKNTKFETIKSEEIQEVVSKETLGHLVQFSGYFDFLSHLVLQETEEESMEGE